jgi:hypothetical protein
MLFSVQILSKDNFSQKIVKYLKEFLENKIKSILKFSLRTYNYLFIFSLLKSK